jgi:muconate cycloisomerase
MTSAAHDRIASVEVIPAAVPFAAKFSVASGEVGGRQNAGPVVFVKLTTESGAVGWGEQRALPTWSYETVESITSTIRRYFAPILIGRSPFGLASIHRDMAKQISPSVSNGMPFARAAVDIALHDLMGRLTGLPVHMLLGGKIHDAVELTWAIGIDSPDAMAETATRWKDGFCFKVKIGGDPDLDTKRIETVRDVVPTMPLWLDANQSYTPANALRLLERIREIDTIRCLEQPTPSVDWLGMAAIRRQSHLPVALDEGCFSAYDVARAVKLDIADQIVLKVCKSGGLREVQASARIASVNGLDLLGSGLTDCGIAFAAAVHVFSTLNLALPAELNGPQFLDNVLVTGLEIHGATVRVPDGPGLGVEVEEERIRSYAIEDK